jgi:alpha-L-rhamnosidase
MHQDSYPSFGDLIARGATTLWEWWGEEAHAITGRSLNHPMMGGYDNWFFNTLAGIRPDESRPGFAHFFLEPHPIRGLDWVRAYHDSPRGRIESHWTFSGEHLEWTVLVPESSQATAVLPLSGEVRHLEAGTYRIEDGAGRTSCPGGMQVGPVAQL